MSELKPITRKEWFLWKIAQGGGGSPSEETAKVGTAKVGSAKVG